MSLKKVRKTKIDLYLAALVLSMAISGCKTKPQDPQIYGEAAGIDEDGILEGTEEKIDGRILDIISAADGGVSLETMKAIIARLGKEGYVAVDSENQIDMAGAERAMAFCRAVELGEEAELTIIEVIYAGGFREYDLSTKEGMVEVIRKYYRCGKDGILKEQNTASYLASLWQYTQEGYLLFEGSYHSEESYLLTLSDVPERIAFRVQPLDEICRELNRKYILPIGYRCNNMFLVNWDESDFGSLDFYDLFDALYPLRFGQEAPYVRGESLEEDVIYRIPKGEFENVVMPYFKISSETLQSKTDYLPTDQVYQYRPRGFQNAEYPDIPYPEVVSYMEKEDGMMELVVNAVYPNDNTSKAFSHKVTVRMLDEGGFQYVSNQMFFPEEGYDAWWHGER